MEEMKIDLINGYDNLKAFLHAYLRSCFSRAIFYSFVVSKCWLDFPDHSIFNCFSYFGN